MHRFHFIEIPTKIDGLPDVLLRWREGIKPFKAGKDAFRDATIWLSVLDLAKRDCRETVCFISSNVHDFADNEGHNLHSDLQSEVEKLGLNVRFFRSLNHFNEVHTNHLNFLNKQLLSANIDCAFLNPSVLEGVRGIHCGYYFETFHRKVSTDYDGILNYDPLQAEFDKSILMFNVGREAKNEYSVWMSLGGEVLVEYLLDDEHFNFLVVHFHTEVNIIIRDKVIVSYEANYHEENSGLSIDDAYEVL
ncbi:PIN domain-containing protein [Dyadobacter fanqingshengii]|uniref:PIN domain-containing protein n=1 Tax=Dyadobacter fanqingshengii TaxID=2906443 RepID=UPI00210336C6|nr:PIN domain-containing protein [Dyadobacter fanqingshengii]